ncbi:rhodanese-like domain-containing protein, partial [Salmonella sp. s51933]|uniref:rhodanese-like domain-containing protein n=1 Tax=Salmonella sp. s51933 TaxID=3160127 RepID=UPI003754524F
GIETRPGVSVGHIPHSANVPFLECLDEAKQTMRDPEQLKEVFAANGVDLSRTFTTSCGSGITACLVAFAAHRCGREDVSVYDGSWAEWGRRAPPEMVEKEVEH